MIGPLSVALLVSCVGSTVIRLQPGYPNYFGATGRTVPLTAPSAYPLTAAAWLGSVFSPGRVEVRFPTGAEPSPLAMVPNFRLTGSSRYIGNNVINPAVKPWALGPSIAAPANFWGLSY